ncbi:MAG: BTAD domain-containing putative transcriptional regulator [Pseudomonadota bacterium]
MTKWSITTFGKLQIYCDGIPFGRRLSKNTKCLIGLLAVNYSRCLGREEIVEKLWSREYDVKCRRRLSTILWRLARARQTDKSCPTTSLVHRIPNGSVCLAVDNNVTLDLSEFQTTFENIPVDSSKISDAQAIRIERAIGLYTGELLEDFDADWTFDVQLYAQQCYLEMLQVLIDYFERRQAHHKVCEYAERFIRSDPFVENVHITLVNAYLAKGQRNHAATCARNWQLIATQELGEPLSVESSQLVRQLKPHASGDVQRIPRRRPALADKRRVDELQSTLDRLLSLCEILMDELRQNNLPSR